MIDEIDSDGSGTVDFDGKPFSCLNHFYRMVLIFSDANSNGFLSVFKC